MTVSSTTRPSLIEALAVRATHDADTLVGVIHHDFDVFGIPHGGYVAALATNAALAATGAPDVFTITTHFLRKAAHGELRFATQTVGASRRFTTVAVTATQGDEVVLHAIASVGDRAGIDGPRWDAAPPPPLDTDDLLPPAQSLIDGGGSFQPPSIAARSGLRLEQATAAFMRGETPGGPIRSVMEVDEVDQAVLVLATDITPPAVWNALGLKGWVPTVELTAHVRAATTSGPLRVDAETRHVSAGFLEEDAVVYDADGAVVAMGRQLARWSQPNG